MATTILKDEDSFMGVLSNASPVVDDPLYRIARDTDHRRLKEAVRRTKQDIKETREATEFKGDALAVYIMQCLRSARSHKQNICEEYNQREAFRLREGVYTELELVLLGGSKTAAWFPLTDRLCRGMSSFLRNIMTRDDENPNWDISATPIPELPKADAEEAAAGLAKTVLDQIALGFDVSDEDIVEELDRIADSLIKEMRDEAERKAMKMTDYIRDLLEEANWRDVFDALLDDVVTFGTGIIKSPYIVGRIDQTYRNGNKIKNAAMKRIASRNVDPTWFFPSPDSTTTQDGAFLCELTDMSIRDLVIAKKLKGFLPKNIELVLAELELGEGLNWLNDYGTIEDLRGKRHTTSGTHGDKVRIVEYHGSIPGRKLASLGVDTWEGEKLDLDNYYEVEVFICNDVVIRAVANINPGQKRPYHKMNLYPRVGSFYGKGIPMAIRDIQRVINGAYRNLVRNMGFASAPIWEIDHALWDTEISKPPKFIEPNMIMDKNSLIAAHNGNALFAHEIRSRGEEFLRIIAQLIEHAEMTVGMPRFLQGDPSGGGGAARTLGGLSTLQNNANIGLKSIVVDLDMDIVKPMIEMIYHWVLCTTDDPDLMGDAQVVVRGATHLLARELNKDSLLQTIGSFFPFVEAGYIKAEGVSALLREAVREIGLDPDDVVIDLAEARRKEEAIQAAVQNVGGIPGGVGAAAQGPSFGPGGAVGNAPVQPQQPFQPQQIAA